MAPALFGHLIETGGPGNLFWGYMLGSGLMMAAAAVEWWLGVDTEQKSLEDVATPLRARGPADGPAPSWAAFRGTRGPHGARTA